MSPIPGLGAGDQSAVDDHVDDPMEEAENERHEEARSGILDVDAHGERRPQIPDYSLGDPIQPDVGAGKDVLQRADSGSRNQAGDRSPASDREKDRDQQREVENLDEAQPPRDKDLDEQRQQRNEDRGRPAKPVHLDFFARGERNCVTHRGGFSRFGTGCRWSFLGSGGGSCELSAGGAVTLSALGLGEGLAGSLDLRTGAGLAAPAAPAGVSAAFTLDLGAGVAEAVPGLGCAAGALTPGGVTLLAVPPAGGLLAELSAGLEMLGSRSARISAARRGVVSLETASVSSAIRVTTRTCSSRSRFA